MTESEVEPKKTMRILLVYSEQFTVYSLGYELAGDGLTSLRGKKIGYCEL